MATRRNFKGRDGRATSYFYLLQLNFKISGNISYILICHAELKSIHPAQAIYTSAQKANQTQTHVK